VLAGLALMLLSLGTGLAVGIAGAVATTAGLWMLAGAIQQRWMGGGPAG
jgi:hypothetical protein